MGSSTVMMWTGFSRLTMSTIDASVVDFPDPVGPVTSTRPRGRRPKEAATGGTPSFSRGRISIGITRMTAPIESRWRNTLTRKRARPGSGWERSSSSSSSKRSRCFCVRMA